MKIVIFPLPPVLEVEKKEVPVLPPPFDYLFIYLFILNKYFLIIHNVCIVSQSINQSIIK